MAGPGVNTTYLAPDSRNYILLQAGTPGNDLVLDTRAFMLGIEDPWDFKMTRDIDGPGYLVADTTAADRCTGSGGPLDGRGQRQPPRVAEEVPHG